MGRESDTEIDELYEVFKAALAFSVSTFFSPQRPLSSYEQPATKKVSSIEEILDSVKQSFRDEIQGYREFHRIFAQTAAEMIIEKPSVDYDFYATELKHKILSDIYDSLLKRL